MKEKPPAGPCARQAVAGQLGVAFGDVMAWVAWTRPVASEDESHVLGCREHPCRVCSVADELGLEVGIRSCPLLKPTARVGALVGIGEPKPGRVCHARTIPRWHVCSPCSLLVRLPFRLGYM